MSCYIKELQARIEELEKLLEWVHCQFIKIGGPLNDNKLKFNNKQLHFIAKIDKIIQNEER